MTYEFYDNLGRWGRWPTATRWRSGRSRRQLARRFASTPTPRFGLGLVRLAGSRTLVLPKKVEESRGLVVHLLVHFLDSGEVVLGVREMIISDTALHDALSTQGLFHTPVRRLRRRRLTPTKKR